MKLGARSPRGAEVLARGLLARSASTAEVRQVSVPRPRGPTASAWLRASAWRRSANAMRGTLPSG
eukprot:9188977-Alexandrium_andersonii.AAC.1